MSSYETGSGPDCAHYADELAELALGISTGRERAEALAHVAQCPACHAEMEQLSLAADSLLEVIPRVDPPLGFEVRLAERLLSGRGTPRRGARWFSPRQWGYRRLPAALACLLAVVAPRRGGGGGLGGARWPAGGAVVVRHRRRRACLGAAARLCGSRHGPGDRVLFPGLGRQRVVVHEPRCRELVRQGDLRAAARERSQGAVGDVLARPWLWGLGREPGAGDGQDRFGFGARRQGSPRERTVHAGPIYDPTHNRGVLRRDRDLKPGSRSLRARRHPRRR
jgi:hypothetical protein